MVMKYHEKPVHIIFCAKIPGFGGFASRRANMWNNRTCFAMHLRCQCGRFGISFRYLFVRSHNFSKLFRVVVLRLVALLSSGLQISKQYPISGSRPCEISLRDQGCILEGYEAGVQPKYTSLRRRIIGPLTGSGNACTEYTPSPTHTPHPPPLFNLSHITLVDFIIQSNRVVARLNVPR